jgi:AcrR family transcriptional regulator
MPVKPWRRAQVIGTREHLIETAARLFGRRGYAGTPLEDVVREAGLSRGAVYHHFEDKRALFEAVIERALRDLVFAVEKRTVKLLAQTGTERPADAARLFAEELSRHTIHRRSVALDGPAVLGPERFSRLLGDPLQEPLERVVEIGVHTGRIEPELVPALARLLFGAILEASQHRARQAHDAKAIERGLEVLVERLLG